MIAHATYTGAPWEVLYRVHDVARGRARQDIPKACPSGSLKARYPVAPLQAGEAAGLVRELVIARSLRTGNVATFLPDSLGLAPTQAPDKDEVYNSIGMNGDRITEELSRAEVLAAQEAAIHAEPRLHA